MGIAKERGSADVVMGITVKLSGVRLCDGRLAREDTLDGV
jgi:hypothetical protein